MRADKQLLRALGRRIAKRRQDKGMTQEQLAQKLRVSDTHVSYMERGERGPSLGMLQRIAKVLDTSIAKLIPPEY
jgi:transcriptional regulator with XRE-family HTH domain